MKTTTKSTSKTSVKSVKAATKPAATATATTTKKAPAKAAAIKAASVAAKKKTQAPAAHGVGRRKSSVARVWLRKGVGAFMVNGKEVFSYFDTEVSRARAVAPWTVLPHLSKDFDIEVNVLGGGMKSQADAVKLGVARALIEVRDDAREVLRSEGLLTVDSRVKERKKYGQPGARRKFQFVKR